jgi:hypothetical protein
MCAATRVQGHRDTKGFCDFLFCCSGLERGIGVEGDAAIAVRGDGDGDQLADFFAEE